LLASLEIGISQPNNPLRSILCKHCSGGVSELQQRVSLKILYSRLTGLPDMERFCLRLRVMASLVDFTILTFVVPQMAANFDPLAPAELEVIIPKDGEVEP
jgi:hypothetical protein